MYLHVPVYDVNNILLTLNRDFIHCSAVLTVLELTC